MKQKNSKFYFIKKTISLFLLYSFVLTNIFAVRLSAQTNTSKLDVSAAPQIIAKYTTDLTALAAQGKIRPAMGFENELNQILKTLGGANSRQPVLLNEIGSDQELIIELLASRIAAGDVPANLVEKKILKLETDVLFSNAKNIDEVSKIIETIFRDLSSSDKNVILFVDELPRFVGISQINAVLTDALLQRKIKIIGGSSKVNYSANIAPSAELSNLFETILMGDSRNRIDANSRTTENVEDFRGDKVSSDLREMMTQDPSGKKRVDVIIQAKDASNASLRAIMAENKVRLQDRVGSSDTLIVNLPLNAVETLAQSGIVNYMSPDRKIKSFGHLENTIGADLTRSQAASGSRAAYNLDGTGIGIAVLDSGLLASHKDFKNNKNSSRMLYSRNFVETESDADDNYGHGTHVAGIAAGNSSRKEGAYRGIAPNANIINLKVLDGLGRGKTSWLLNALDWIKLNHRTYNIRVVNLSLGGSAVDSYVNDPACRKVRELSELGILVVAAAGNEGKDNQGNKSYGRIHSPGSDPSVLTVGAANTKDTDSRDDDGIASFSSRGPTRGFYTDDAGRKIFDNAIKPDIVAPGNKIVSARAKSSSYLASNFPGLSDGLTNLLDSNDNMMSMSGTSMATPVAAGAAALLFQINPNLTPQMVKMILEYTAQPLSGYNMFEQGAGQLNVEGAVRLTKAYRTDIDFNASATSGMSLLLAGVNFPAATTTIRGLTFNWSQGILTNHAYLKGQNLAARFHNAYKNNMWFEKGVDYSETSNYVLNNNFANATTLSANAKVIVSNGLTMGSGSIFCNFGASISNGVFSGNNILSSDGGVVLSDGVLTSDGVLVSDGVLISDNSAQSSISTIYGDD